MRGENRDVTVLEAEDRVLKRVTAPPIAKFFDRIHRERGVDIRVGARVAAISGEGSAHRRCDWPTGTEIAADAVLLAAGAKANDELAEVRGPCLPRRDPGRRDRPYRSRNVYAIGDARAFRASVTVGCCGLNACRTPSTRPRPPPPRSSAQPASYDPVPWFWSDQYEFKLQIGTFRRL